MFMVMQFIETCNLVYLIGIDVKKQSILHQLHKNGFQQSNYKLNLTEIDFNFALCLLLLSLHAVNFYALRLRISAPLHFKTIVFSFLITGAITLNDCHHHKTCHKNIQMFLHRTKCRPARRNNTFKSWLDVKKVYQMQSSPLTFSDDTTNYK